MAGPRTPIDRDRSSSWGAPTFPRNREVREGAPIGRPAFRGEILEGLILALRAGFWLAVLLVGVGLGFVGLGLVLYAAIAGLVLVLA